MKKVMIQQVIVAPRKIIFRDEAVPDVNSNEVLIRIVKIGICGSDIHVYHGKHPFTSYPITQGHEVSGQIVSFGENVTGFTIGQKVTIQPQIFCGQCHPCRHGKYNLCENLRVMGFQSTGVASEYFVVDASKVIPLPDSMTYDEGAMIEPLSVAVHAVRQAGDIKEKNITVIGAGPIGNLVSQVAYGLGANKVLITDVSDWRLDKARECGIKDTANTLNTDFNTALIETFGPDKADIIYDCAGNDNTINQAIRCARKGSQIILVAVFEGMASVDLAVLNDHELNLNSTMMYRREDYEKAVSLAETKKVKLLPLITNRFSFEKYQEAYEYIDNNKEHSMKVIINVGGVYSNS